MYPDGHPLPDHPQTVTVNLAYTGTATHGTDYTAATSITINAGQLTGTTNITATQDTVYEGSETVVVDIASVTNATESGTQQVSTTITDNDSQPTRDPQPEQRHHRRGSRRVHPDGHPAQPRPRT